METKHIKNQGDQIEMEQLYKLNEIQDLLKVSRAQMYRLMDAGLIPFVQLGGQRRFIGSQVAKALKNMQTRQNVEKVRDFHLVPKDTLSDASAKLGNLNTQANKDLRKALKRPYKIRNSKTVKRTRAI